ncbi:MAG: hypothetical protein GY749_34680 [Desulfobacteraceae bacterium]|nr:hypothetical protein [Desulfobacteraceae bacterium]
MSVKEIEFSPEDMIISFLNVLAYIISPILLIWAVNTLFDCGIQLKFKTWLAGLVIIMLIKFHFRGSGEPHYPYEDYYDENEDYYDDDDEYDDEDPEERKARLKAKLIAYQEHKNKKNSPPE